MLKITSASSAWVCVQGSAPHTRQELNIEPQLNSVGVGSQGSLLSPHSATARCDAAEGCCQTCSWLQHFIRRVHSEDLGFFKWFSPFQLWPLLFRLWKRKMWVMEGGAIGRMKEVQVKLRFSFCCCLQDKEVQIPRLEYSLCSSLVSGSGTQLGTLLWTQWQTALAWSRGWGLVPAARAPGTAFKGKNEEEREKTQVSLRSLSNE